MSYLYLTDSSAKLGISGNYLTVKIGSEIIEKIPIETLENVSIYGKSQVTTQCIQECLKRSIPIVYYSQSGKYYGRLQPAGHIKVKRQRKQANFRYSEMALELAKKIIMAKVQNQRVILRRYAVSRKAEFQEAFRYMKILENNIKTATSVEEIMGYEGNAARTYFRKLSGLVEPEFCFDGRN